MAEAQLVDRVESLVSDWHQYAPGVLKVRTKDMRLVPFVPNEAQDRIHTRLDAQLAKEARVRALILKGRQQGSSTYIGGRFYRRASTQSNVSVQIMTHRQSATNNLFAMVKRYYDNSPEGFRPVLRKSNAKELNFKHLDSQYSVSTAGSSGAGRAETAQFFHASEFAFWLNAADHMAGIGQTVADITGTELVIESTANGYGNHFHKMWRRAIKAEKEGGDFGGSFIPIFVPWFIQAEYQRPVPDGFDLTEEESKYLAAYEHLGMSIENVVWRRFKANMDFEGDLAYFGQEYPATHVEAFQKTLQDCIVSPRVLTAATAPKPYLEPIGPLIIGVDPAERGTDKTAIAYRRGRICIGIERFHHSDFRDTRQVTMRIAGIVSDRIQEMKPDFVVVDSVGVGVGVHDRLVELHHSPIRFQGGANPVGEERGGDGRHRQYVRWKDQCWGRMKDWLEDSPCVIPDDDELISDISAPWYDYDSSRRFHIQDKKSARKDGIPSWDSADALSMTFAMHFGSRSVSGPDDDEEIPTY